MSCKYATWDGGQWNCSVSGDRCMFYIPSSKACAERYGEGPDADEVENLDEYIGE